MIFFDSLREEYGKKKGKSDIFKLIDKKIARKTRKGSQEVTGLKFYILDCGCIYYYQRVFRDGNLDPQIGIYRDAEHGPCEICMVQGEGWKEKVVDEAMICNREFQALA